MAYIAPPPLGQAAMSASTPVTIASDQTIISTKLTSGLNATTGTITSATSAVVLSSLSGVGAVNITIYGTYAGVNATFQGYDGTNWNNVVAVPQGTTNPTPSTTTGVLASNATVTYVVAPLLGVQQFRVQATAWTSGTANVIITPSAQFVQPYVVVNNPTASNLQASVTQSTSPWITREQVASTPTITQVTPTTTSTTLKAANTNRKALIIYNGGTSDMYISYGGTAASTAFTIYLPSLGTATIRGEEYAGAVNGIWIATGGNSAQVTEIAP